MKFLPCLPLMLALSACATDSVTYDTPSFDFFRYTGDDSRYHVPYNPETQYLNPVISGTNPDPAICRKGEDYYMANSSFVYWPAIPIWHSKDLIDWDFCGYVIDRPSQCYFPEGIRISGGVYAPDIKYCEQNQTFYLIVTLVDCSGNVIFKTKDPRQGWSEAIPVPEVHGIDPSFLFDTDGKCYILNNDEPAYAAEYSGHRAIWGREYDLATDKVCGEPVVLIDKGIRPEEKPIWIEGPHLYHFSNYHEGKLYDQYYLMDAEGGTGDWHSEVVLAGRSPLGKFTPCRQNPILTQRTLPHERLNPISCAGHADLVDTYSADEEEREWWSVFLACTTYDGDQLYNTGRSTFLLPTSWKKDPVNGGIQPVILDADKEIPTVCQKSSWQHRVAMNTTTDENRIGHRGDSRNLLTGNGTYTDDFDGSSLYPLWFTLRTPSLDQYVEDGRLAAWYTIQNGRLQLTGRSVRLSDKGQPSMLCRWTKNSTYRVETRLNFTPKDSLYLAGLTLFQNEHSHYLLGKQLNAAGCPEIVLLKSDRDQKDQIVAVLPLESAQNSLAVDLKAEVNEHQIQFSYSLDGGNTWTLVGDVQDADILTTNYAGGFTGSVVGVYSYKP